MKKNITLLTASLLCCMGMMAQTSYSIKINGVEVTSDNAASITGSGINGNISYDAASNVLTLDNATVSGTGGNNALDCKNEGLTVKLVGTNTLTSGNYSTLCFFKNATITGSGTLSATSAGSTAIQVIDYTLNITGGCSVTAEGIGGISGMMGNENLNIDASTVKASGFVFGAISDINVHLTNCEVKSGSYEGEEVSIEPTATAIKKITTTDGMSQAPIYSLNGRLLSGKPAKGLYIQNGKKVMAQP